jgi:hypothetical protein
VKVTTPLALETPEAAEMTELPVPVESVTVLPATGFEFESFRVTVTVEVAIPLSRMGDVAVTVDVDAETAPLVKTTVAVDPPVMAVALMVPLIVAVPALVDDVSVAV